MTKFKKIQTQFEMFVKNQKVEEMSSYERKLINLIRDNFGEVASCGTAQGYRAYFLKELIYKNRNTVKEELIFSEQKDAGVQLLVTKLDSLIVESFRGFKTKENFSFDCPKILVYGPNGSGKTSFCEALEYALLGYLSEADGKRMGVESYITNVNTGTYIVPVLKGLINDGSVIDLVANHDAFYFCFIEKNRIIDFARYSSKTASKQENLLATLFGLDEFYSFIGGFTGNIEGYIPIESEKQKELDKKKATIEVHKQSIEASKGKIGGLQVEKGKLVEKSKMGKTFEELDLFINGQGDIKGRIDLIDDELQKPSSKIYNIKNTAEFFTTISNTEAIVQKFRDLNAKFEKEKSKINFRKIFEVVQEFEQVIKDKCPVCETPIEETKINPYHNAKNKLKELEEIASIEQERDVCWEKVIENVCNVIDSFEQREKANEEFGGNIFMIENPSLKPIRVDITGNETYLKTVTTFFENIRLQKDLLLEFDKNIKTTNEQVEKHSQIRSKLVSEKLHLRMLKIEIDAIKTKEKTHNETIDGAKKVIKEFDEVNVELLASVEKELKEVEENKKYVEAYRSILQKLDIYKKQLPVSLVGNLNLLTKEFYNVINQDDIKCELIEKIELPSNAGEGIRIWFQDEPEKELNAMHVLSEGHTRCLGLAILLAKAVQDGLPFIIFDDVVNAIDDDHRGRIRELLFNNNNLKDKQVILTSHSEEYIREIENKHFTKDDYQDTVKVITFLKPENRNIEVLETEVFNYLVKANEFLRLNNKKDALERCRKALENIGDILWRKLVNDEKYDSNLTVKLRSPKAKPELRILIEALKKRFEKINIPKFNIYLTYINWFLELEKKDKIVWDYLNKGTHEESDRDDFDLLIVKEVVNGLIEFDQNLKNPARAVA